MATIWCPYKLKSIHWSEYLPISQLKSHDKRLLLPPNCEPGTLGEILEYSYLFLLEY